MKAAVLHGRCQCADQCGGGSRGEHVHNLAQFMAKLDWMLANPDPYDAQYSPSELSKIWLDGSNGFVVLGKFRDDFYVTEEVVTYLRPYLVATSPLVEEGENIQMNSHDLLQQFRQAYFQS